MQDCARSSFAACGKAQVSVVLDLNDLDILSWTIIAVEIVEEDNHHELWFKV